MLYTVNVFLPRYLGALYIFAGQGTELCRGDVLENRIDSQASD